MVHLSGKKVRLAKGKENKKQAEKKFRELQYLRDTNPAPAAGQPTVASIIEHYLQHAAKQYAERSLYKRRPILQAFAEEHGFRPATDKDCLPFRLTSFIDRRPDWKSDWTKAGVVAVVQRPFNWAVKERSLRTNPFRGKTQRGGKPRRPVTDAEFSGLLRAAARKRIFTPMAPMPSGRSCGVPWPQAL